MFTHFDPRKEANEAHSRGDYFALACAVENMVSQCKTGLSPEGLIDDATDCSGEHIPVYGHGLIRPLIYFADRLGESPEYAHKTQALRAFENACASAPSKSLKHEAQACWSKHMNAAEEKDPLQAVNLAKGTFETKADGSVHVLTDGLFFDKAVALIIKHLPQVEANDPVKAYELTASVLKFSRVSTRPLLENLIEDVAQVARKDLVLAFKVMRLVIVNRYCDSKIAEHGIEKLIELARPVAEKDRELVLEAVGKVLPFVPRQSEQEGRLLDINAELKGPGTVTFPKAFIPDPLNRMNYDKTLSHAASLISEHAMLHDENAAREIARIGIEALRVNPLADTTSLADTMRAEIEQLYPEYNKNDLSIPVSGLKGNVVAGAVAYAVEQNELFPIGRSALEAPRILKPHACRDCCAC